jgi:hypothetical protein
MTTIEILKQIGEILLLPSTIIAISAIIVLIMLFRDQEKSKKSKETKLKRKIDMAATLAELDFVLDSLAGATWYQNICLKSIEQAKDLCREAQENKPAAKAEEVGKKIDLSRYEYKINRLRDDFVAFEISSSQNYIEARDCLNRGCFGDKTTNGELSAANYTCKKGFRQFEEKWRVYSDSVGSRLSNDQAELLAELGEHLHILAIRNMQDDDFSADHLSFSERVDHYVYGRDDSPNDIVEACLHIIRLLTKDLKEKKNTDRENLMLMQRTLGVYPFVLELLRAKPGISQEELHQHLKKQVSFGFTSAEQVYLPNLLTQETTKAAASAASAVETISDFEGLLSTIQSLGDCGVDTAASAKEKDAVIITRSLLNNPNWLHKKYRGGQTILMCLAEHGLNDIIETLISEAPYIDLTERNTDGKTAIDLAAQAKQYSTAKLLYESWIKCFYMKPDALDMNYSVFSDFSSSPHDKALVLRSDTSGVFSDEPVRSRWLDQPGAAGAAVASSGAASAAVASSGAASAAVASSGAAAEVASAPTDHPFFAFLKNVVASHIREEQSAVEAAASSELAAKAEAALAPSALADAGDTSSPDFFDFLRSVVAPHGSEEQPRAGVAPLGAADCFGC